MSEVSIPAQRPPQPRANPILHLIPLAVIPIAGLLVFAVGIAMGARRDNIWILGLAVLTGMVAMFPLLLDRVRSDENRQILITFLSLAWMASFVLPVYSDWYLNDGILAGIPGLVGIQARDVILGQAAALLGLVGLLLGFYLPIGSIVGRALPRPTRDWSQPECLAIAMVLIPLGFSVALAGQFGLIPERVGTGVLSGIARSYNIGLALLAIVYFRHHSQAALITLILLIPIISSLAFFTGSKSQLLQPMMMVAFAHIVLARRIRVFWIAGGVTAIVLIYPISVFFREAVNLGNYLSAVEVLSNPGRSFGLLSAFVSQADLTSYLTAGLEATGHRFNALGITSVIVRDTPERVPFQGGWSIGYVFVAYVPRILWADKPMVTMLGQWITNNYGPGPHITSHTAPSWVGEFYLNFGFPGILLGCITLGVLFRLLQELFFRDNETTPLVLMGVVILSALVLSVEKSLVVTLNSLVFNTFPIVIAYVGAVALFGGRRRPVPVQRL